MVRLPGPPVLYGVTVFNPVLPYFVLEKGAATNYFRCTDLACRILNVREILMQFLRVLFPWGTDQESAVSRAKRALPLQYPKLQLLDFDCLLSCGIDLLLRLISSALGGLDTGIKVGDSLGGFFFQVVQFRSCRLQLVGHPG